MVFTIRIFIGLLVLTVSGARADIFGPDTYEDCILANMKQVTNNIAAVAIRQACREKFPQRCSDIDDSTTQGAIDRAVDEIGGLCIKDGAGKSEP